MFSSDHELSLVHRFCLLSSGKYSMSEEELLAEFEHFERELKVENILKEVKSELSFLKDNSIDEFAQQLEQRDQQRRLAQPEREALVREQWSPGLYPQLTCNWFVEGLNFCCNRWRHLFKRPTTPPPVRKKLKKWRKKWKR